MLIFLENGNSENLDGKNIFTSDSENNNDGIVEQVLKNSKEIAKKRGNRIHFKNKFFFYKLFEFLRQADLFLFF